MTSSPASLSARPPKTPWGLVVLLGSMSGFAPMGIDLYLPAMQGIEKSLHGAPGSGQATLAAFLAGMAIGQFAYGPASDRFGRRAPILVGVGMFIIGSIACALAPSIPFLVAARFFQAFGGCAGAVVGRAVVRDRFNHTETARMLSLQTLIMGLAPILAPLFGGWLLLVFDWRAIFWVLTIFAMLVGGAVFFFLSESRSEETAAQARAENPFRAYATLSRSPRLLGYTLAGALNGAVLFTYIAASPDLIIGHFHVSPQAFGWLFMLNAFGLIGASQFNRWLLRRITPDQVLARAGVISIGFGVILLACAATGFGSMWGIIITLFFTLATFGPMQGNTMAGALSVDPVRAGSISALVGGVSFGAGALASWLGSVLHDGTARPMAGVMLVALVGSGLFLRLMAFPKRA